LTNKLTFVENNNIYSFLNAIDEQLISTDNITKLKLTGEGNLFEQLNTDLSFRKDIVLVHDKQACDVDVLCFENAEQQDDALHCFIDNTDNNIIANRTSSYYKNRPLYLIGIPKSGTHLLMALANCFGYVTRGTTPEKPKGGEWHYVEYSNAHTIPKNFFVESVYQGDAGLRDHPFIFSPALFIFRHPCDILVSEANYYHRKGKTAFYNYFRDKTFEQRLSLLINDKALLGTANERIGQYLPWLSFSNVIPLSFEELIGTEKGGDDELLHKLIWSLQLKLNVPGVDETFAVKLKNTGSDTHFKGLTGVYKDNFNQQHFDEISVIDNDFINGFGYSVDGNDSVITTKADKFRQRKLLVDTAPANGPVIIENQFLNHRIIKYQDELYGVPFGTKLDDLKSLLSKSDSPIVTGKYVDEVKVKLIKKVK